MYAKSFLTAIFSVLALSLSAQSKSYKYTVDVTRVENDRVLVELSTPKIATDETVFYLPKIIPGTYSIADYGRYVYDFKAFDKKGKQLVVQRVDSNGWKISDAKKLAKLSYWVDDVNDTKKAGPHVYPMAGTNIEEGKNFVINTSGFFGYFDGLKDTPVNFDVIRPKDFYGSTGLIALQTGIPLTKIKKEIEPASAEKRVDRYVVENYDRLIDSPLMYAKPDTAVIKVANAEVLIGSYSPNAKITAKEIANTVREVLFAQSKFLGGKLPVDKYAFIFYFTDKPINIYGALEHSYSSFYWMPEQTLPQMKRQLRDFAAHEFFHIVTPLNIHSEEIQHFGFNDPKMSKHLWMYEGVTEYFAGNVQVKYELITQQQYLDVIRQKLNVSDGYLDDVPFTDISKFTLEKYSDQYNNVYQKGALIGMSLDIKLRQLSDGKYGMQNLMADLSKKYGKRQAFQDEELFGEIEKLTYPEIGEFLRRYVAGPERIPYSDLFQSVGVNYVPEKEFSEYSLGYRGDGLGLVEVNGVNRLSIVKSEGINDQGKSIGLKKGDIILKINGELLPEIGPALGPFLEKHKNGLTDGGTISYTVSRNDENGVAHDIELKSTVAKTSIKRKHLLSFSEQASEKELALRKAWLTPQ